VRPTEQKPSSETPAKPAALVPQDRLFAEPRAMIPDFDFGAKTASVFDDMLGRSVPYYEEIQRLTAELAVDFVTPGSTITDLGCSTCTSFLQIGALLPRDMDVRFVGVDSSQEMLERANQKLVESKFPWPYELRHLDMHQDLTLENSSVVLLVLTLQFVRPLHRERIVRQICEGLRPDGCLILVEKVLGESSTFNRLFIKHYYDLKRRNGYSDLEIAQKREALENVLIPYRLKENEELLKRCGFRDVDVFFKWYNFCGILAMK